MKKYILKEYGSWGVMTMAFASGLISARHAGPASLSAFFALALLINPNSPLGKRSNGRH